MDCLLYAKHTGAAMVCRTNMVPVHCLVGETDALIRHHNKLGGDSRVLEKHLRGRFYPGLEPGKASWRKWPLSYSWIMCWIKPDTECCRVERGKELDFQTTVSTKAHSKTCSLTETSSMWANGQQKLRGGLWPAHGSHGQPLDKWASVLWLLSESACPLRSWLCCTPVPSLDPQALAVSSETWQWVDGWWDLHLLNVS